MVDMSPIVSPINIIYKVKPLVIVKKFIANHPDCFAATCAKT